MHIGHIADWPSRRSILSAVRPHRDERPFAFTLSEMRYGIAVVAVGIAVRSRTGRNHAMPILVGFNVRYNAL